ncbi:hypothetical protein A2V56_04550 [Candidatus Woesebacteria bacterium RBG_19FT_COMBO_42_9]|uniref:Uncharacterized protein n=1 Tax=Candidatus Woesebacteria bacterium RBG_16_42_24 TaxID=1802485 RepID=A0A1F7XLY3_9BACT|nr:MAG: hypothetical protein A2V97_04530 [Candidatus Woesebacteria bacterium RBG_16_42_24]OGM16231.1 MAG: hypothetical protein A2V56_04550 [Candidatus Woesebacteria bacterium RBG_19FT_COMBO_42_9]OGM66321.1 MAG: hypothetical protein A2985_03920 [Candidatus Woesebacteria bacterium RIFCSPLOWO2_01_FULL_43_11]
MSKLYYDHLVVLDEVEAEIKKSTKTLEEKEELWKVVDETIHHRVMGCVLDKLPREHHEEFLHKFHKAPHDESLIDYLKEKAGENIEELIRQEIGNLAFELLQEIRGKK